MTLIHFDM